MATNQSVSFLPPRIVSDICWPSSRIAIVHSNMCSGRALSLFDRPLARAGKWRGARGRPTHAVWRNWRARCRRAGCRRPVARPGRATLAIASAFGQGRRQGYGPDLLRTAHGHARHWTGRAAGQSRQRQPAHKCSAGELPSAAAAPRIPPSSAPTILGFAEKVRGRGRPLRCGPAQARCLDRREEPNPGARPRSRACRSSPEECGTMTHDYGRNGTTTLFAAPRIYRRNRDPDAALRDVFATRSSFASSTPSRHAGLPETGKSSTPSSTTIAAHKQPNVLRWLAGRPRWTFRHYSGLGLVKLCAVEGFFSAITRHARSNAVPSTPSTICGT